jgi:hypothetical protein
MLGAVPHFPSASFVYIVSRPSPAANARLAVRKLSSAIRHAPAALGGNLCMDDTRKCGKRHSKGSRLPQKIIRRSIPEACEFVFDKQLAPFQGGDLEIIDRWMSMGFGYFRLQGAMASFKFCKMRFYGH